jgi:hypothetical protein
MEDEADPRLPRPIEDPGRLRNLREQARKRLNEEGSPAYPAYGAAPVYGGPPVRRRWTVRGLLMVAGALLLGVLAWIFGRIVRPVPVYGGPPVQPPPYEREKSTSPPAPVYGGPVPRPGPVEPRK